MDTFLSKQLLKQMHVTFINNEIIVGSSLKNKLIQLLPKMSTSELIHPNCKLFCKQLKCVG